MCNVNCNDKFLFATDLCWYSSQNINFQENGELFRLRSWPKPPHVSSVKKYHMQLLLQWHNYVLIFSMIRAICGRLNDWRKMHFISRLG